jgi:hypothetical protein
LRRQNLSLRLLLLDDSPLRRLRAQIILGNVESGSCLIKSGARKRASLHEPIDAIEVDLRLISLRLQRLDLCIQRLHLQHELLVSDDGNRLTSGHGVTFPDMQLSDRAADAAAGRHHADALDRGKHGLLVGDRAWRNVETFRVTASCA